MTEKRFTYDFVSVDCPMFYDNKEVIDYDDVVDCLNEQHETIRQLKQAYSDAKSDVERYEQILKDIMEDNLLIQDMKKRS